MSNYTITGNASGGRYPVRQGPGGAVGTVPQPQASGPAFDIDDTIAMDQGNATRSGTKWVLQQTVTLDPSWTTDMGTNEVPATVEYSAERLRECGVSRWNPQHDPTKPKKVQLGGGHEATYKGDGPVDEEGGDGTFECGDRTWTLPTITQGRPAFVRAKADHDWEQRTPLPPKAVHREHGHSDDQYKGANVVLLNRDPALERYFGRPDARRQPDGAYLEKSPRFTWLTSLWTEDELELRERPGGAADDESSSWGTAELSWTNDVPDTQDGTAAPDEAGVGAKQRLRIRVPDVYTQMSLGEAYRNQDAQGFAYPGFGLETDGHIFMHAKGASSSVMVQASKDATFQAEGGAAIGGKAGLAAASAGGVIMAGGGGVTIIGGQPNGWIGNRPSDGTNPGSAPWISNISAASGVVAAVGAGIDAWIALSGAAKAAHDAKQGNEPMPWRGTFTKVAAYLGGVVGGLASTIGALGALDGSAQSLNLWDSNGFSTFASQFGGTFIHGTGGMILTSTITTGIYSLMGTTIGTPLALGMFGGSVDLQGKEDVSVQSSKGKMTLSAGKTLHLSATEAVSLASLTAKLGLSGLSISVGSRAGEGGQAGTKDIGMDAEQVVITTQKLSLLQSDERASVEGLLHARLNSKNGYTYVMGKQGVSVSSGSGKATLSSPKQAGLRSGSMLVTVAPDKAVIGKAPGDLPAPPAPPTFEKRPKKPKSKKKLNAWLDACDEISKKNADKEKDYQSSVKSWKKDVDAMKEASVGIVIKKSAVNIVVDGHRLTIDSSTVKHPSLKILK